MKDNKAIVDLSEIEVNTQGVSQRNKITINDMLTEAVLVGDEKGVRKCLAAGANPLMKNSSGFSALFHSASMLIKGGQLKHKTINLVLAQAVKQKEVADKEFSSKPVSINMHSVYRDPDNNLNTMLHMAIQAQELTMLDELLDLDADVMVVNGEGLTPLEYATKLHKEGGIKTEFYANVIDSLSSVVYESEEEAISASYILDTEDDMALEIYSVAEVEKYDPKEDEIENYYEISTVDGPTAKQPEELYKTHFGDDKQGIAEQDFLADLERYSNPLIQLTVLDTISQVIRFNESNKYNGPTSGGYNLFRTKVKVGFTVNQQVQIAGLKQLYLQIVEKNPDLVSIAKQSPLLQMQTQYQVAKTGSMLKLEAMEAGLKVNNSMGA